MQAHEEKDRRERRRYLNKAHQRGEFGASKNSYGLKTMWMEYKTEEGATGRKVSLDNPTLAPERRRYAETFVKALHHAYEGRATEGTYLEFLPTDNSKLALAALSHSYSVPGHHRPSLGQLLNMSRTETSVELRLYSEAIRNAKNGAKGVKALKR